MSNGFFAWLSPVIHMKEEEMIQNIGLDATTFLRFIRLLRSLFTVVALIAIGLLVMYIIYNFKNIEADSRSWITLLTIQNLSGAWMWATLAASYLISESIRMNVADVRLRRHVS